MGLAARVPVSWRQIGPLAAYWGRIVGRSFQLFPLTKKKNPRGADAKKMFVPRPRDGPDKWPALKAIGNNLTMERSGLLVAK